MNVYSKLLKIKNKKVLTLLEYILSIIISIPFYTIIRRRALKELKQKKYKYNFSVCAIFKNEAPFLKEWIEYNKVIGTDHIYLYNNNSTDNYLDILQPYIDAGFISIVDWPKQYAQFESYEDCYYRFGEETKWLGFFDIDEYLCPLKEECVSDFLKKYDGFPAILIYWRMFGTNGLMEHDFSKLITEQYTCSAYNLDGTGKVIISTLRYYKPTRFYHHFINFKCNLLKMTIKIPVVSEHKKFLFLPQILKAPIHNTIQLNHYFSKAYKLYISKIKKGTVSNATNNDLRKKERYFYDEEMRNNVSENKDIYRFLIKLKLALGI